jgi:hypothetical protein
MRSGVAASTRASPSSFSFARASTATAAAAAAAPWRHPFEAAAAARSCLPAPRTNPPTSPRSYVRVESGKSSSRHEQIKSPRPPDFVPRVRGVGFQPTRLILLTLQRSTTKRCLLAALSRPRLAAKGEIIEKTSRSAFRVHLFSVRSTKVGLGCEIKNEPLSESLKNPVRIVSVPVQAMVDISTNPRLRARTKMKWQPINPQPWRGGLYIIGIPSRVTFSKSLTSSPENFTITLTNCPYISCLYRTGYTRTVSIWAVSQRDCEVFGGIGEILGSICELVKCLLCITPLPCYW